MSFNTNYNETEICLPDEMTDPFYEADYNDVDPFYYSEDFNKMYMDNRYQKLESCVNFDPEKAFKIIEKHWLDFASRLNVKRWVIAMSGGKDSLVAAGLACKIFGSSNVHAVFIPNGIQADISDAVDSAVTLGIVHKHTINIEDAFKSITHQIADNGAWSILPDAKINLPPRLRMAVTMAVAQTVNGMMINTSNLTEDNLGYCTLFGDDCGSYSPMQYLTVSEVIALGDWLELPTELVHKVPADGLQGDTDEQRLGMKYRDVDIFIRTGATMDLTLKNKIFLKYAANKFKLDMIKLPGPEMPYPDFVRKTNVKEIL